ncbi:hypothetical protein MLD38_014273 [Melastoma candidum]|uniref:Uncharacterized protein n=1 Tax=Melastoma candidum TaxID=119954 RepID=A0ACB9RKP3_9MYRT|nr:hypothetical protein MLD38_014273 [Melastoma candidum]
MPEPLGVIGCALWHAGISISSCLLGNLVRNSPAADSESFSLPLHSSPPQPCSLYLLGVTVFDLSVEHQQPARHNYRRYKLIVEMGGAGSPLDCCEEIPDEESSQTPPGYVEEPLDECVRMFNDSLPFGKKHEFWETQPVCQFKDLGNPDLPEGPIEQSTPSSEVMQEPYALPPELEWTTCDMTSEETSDEIYEFLNNNYVEDDENMFRFDYSKEFLRWALCPPGYYKSWHVGFRDKASRKLVGFITGIPARMRVRGEVIDMAEINFLCVHKELRSRRLAPVLIKEVVRRFRLENIWQAAKTAGAYLPTPIATCQYWHRSLNPTKLINIGFSSLPSRMTTSQVIHLYELPDTTSTPGFRKMGPHDVPAVTRLLRDYLTQFVVAPDFDEDTVRHWLLPIENVVDTFVVEHPDTGDITDFCSFSCIPLSILGNPDYSTLKAAYSYYNVSTKTPLDQLMNDALIVAKQRDFDVFNALHIMHNKTFLNELKFLPGSGYLHYYLYNYRLQDRLLPSELGLVLL